MLTKINRLDKNSIKEIFQVGKFINSPNLTFKYIVKKDLSNPKIAFIASKTIHKNAVIRNLLRRRGYKAVEDLLGQFPKGVVGAFIFTKNSLKEFGLKKTKDYNGILNIRDEIKSILFKIN